SSSPSSTPSSTARRGRSATPTRDTTTRWSDAPTARCTSSWPGGCRSGSPTVAPTRRVAATSPRGPRCCSTVTGSPRRWTPTGRRRKGLWIAGLLAGGLLGAFTVWCAFRASLYPVDALATHTPRRTALMLQRAREAAKRGRVARVDQRWVPYERISPLLRRAILVAEDDAFFAHGGLDWDEIRESARRDLERRRVVRGGSTITQQLAKNVFLGDARTPARKL